MSETMPLTDFLLARIAEDEAQAERRFAEWRESGGVLDLDVTLGPARILAECEAKRRIVAEHRPSGEYDPDSCVLCQWDSCCDAPRPDYHDSAGEFPCPTLRALAAIYADHPDYRAEWKP